MKIQYDEGPDEVIMGVAGKFFRGVPREIEDGLAKRVLAKKTIKFRETAARVQGTGKRGQ